MNTMAALRDTMPGQMAVAGARAEFVGALRPGDVLLFQGAEFHTQASVATRRAG